MEHQAKYALTPIAGAIAAALTPAHQALAQEDSAALEEIIVTATKRTVSVQDIPASVQALTADTIAAMGAKEMEDYSRFIPSVNVVTYGAGSSTVVFRGAVTGQGYIAQSTSSVYLDEISITTTGSQPAIRMVDIERVEALSGPQGTLYGSDAQAGTMRIVTNKPVMNAYEAIIDLEARGGDQSDPSYRGSLVFNIPLVEDKLALRLVGFSDRDGGYIDNVLGHTANVNHAGWTVPSGYGTLDNSAVVEENWNQADTTGARAILQWDMTDNWSSTFTALTQATDAGADNDYDPFVGDLQTSRFHDEYREDEYQMYSFVLEGDMGFAQLVGAVNYYDRDIKALYDITNYAHYWGVYNEICQPLGATADYPDYFADAAGNALYYPVYCQGPTIDSDFFSSYYSPAQQDKFTTEIRLSSSGDTIDWLAGVYHEESNDAWQAPFATPTAGGDGSNNTYQNSTSLQWWEWYFSNYYGSAATYPEATSHWYSQSSTDWEQNAVFGEFTWHMNDSWDLTLGGRYFKRTNTNFYIVDHPGDVGLNGEPDIGDENSRQFRLANNNQPPPHHAEETEFIPKVALAYRTGNDNMAYGLYTRGKRPGGVNRARGTPFFPVSYDADLMDNYELGWRSGFADGRGRLNLTGYYMVWTDFQLEMVDPSVGDCPTPGPDPIAGVCGQPWQQVVANAGEAHIAGLNIELDYAFNDNWIFGGNIEFIEAETDESLDVDGDGSLELTAGTPLPLTPELKGSAWLDFDTPVQWFGGTDYFARLQVSYTGSSLNKLEPDGLDTPNPQFETPSYTIADIRTGWRGESWEFSVFLNNITDERAIYTIGSGEMEWGWGNSIDNRPHVQRAYTNRPRELGMRFAKRWGS